MNNKHITVELICKLYYGYGKSSDKKIGEWLDKTILVIKKETIHGLSEYYVLSDELMRKLHEKKRQISLTFHDPDTSNKMIGNLVEYKTIDYLVKSSSRFFLKPDIGEIIDAIHYSDSFDAICINDQYIQLPNTDGEHFIMNVTLLKYDNPNKI